MSLFNPDAVLPEQYSAVPSDHRGVQSERHLMLAVLQDAVECYQKYALARDPRGRTLFTDAVEWIESTDRQWPFAYENICDSLGLDPASVRSGLSKWGAHTAPTKRRAPRIVPLFGGEAPMPCVREA
jgi:hypothetical protein